MPPWRNRLLPLGSVAHTLVHQSTVPLLVLRQQETPAPIEPGRAFRTLVPLDGSALAEAALAPAEALTTALCSPQKGVLRLVQVVKEDQTTAQEGGVFALNEETHRLAHSYLVAVAQRVKRQEADQSLSLTASVERVCDVASALLEVAERAGPGGSDLIAISTHGRHRLDRWVMGSVTQRLGLIRTFADSADVFLGFSLPGLKGDAIIITESNVMRERSLPCGSG